MIMLSTNEHNINGADTCLVWSSVRFPLQPILSTSFQEEKTLTP